MISLALINEFLGQPPNASAHGYQIDHIIEFSHWFMGALFVGWSAFFIYVLIRFRQSRSPVASHEGVTSGISTHLEFAVVLIEAVLLIGFAVPLWAKRVNDFPPTRTPSWSMRSASSLTGTFISRARTAFSVAVSCLWFRTIILSVWIPRILPARMISSRSANSTCRSIAT